MESAGYIQSSQSVYSIIAMAYSLVDFILAKIWIVQHTYSTVESQCDEHEEEDDCPEGGSSQCGYGLRVHLKHQARSCNTGTHIQICSINQNYKDLKMKNSISTCLGQVL